MLKAVLHRLQAEKCTILMAWSSVISATYQLWCLMQLVCTCSSSAARVMAQRVCFAITCSLHKCWSHSGARCFGRLRSLTLRELKYGADLPDPKRLGNQIRHSLALRLSESLATWYFQVHRTIEFAVLEKTCQDHRLTDEQRERGLVTANETSQTFLLLYPFGFQSWFCQGNYLNSQGFFSKGTWRWRLWYTRH